MNRLKEAKTPTAFARAEGCSTPSLSPPLSSNSWHSMKETLLEVHTHIAFSIIKAKNGTIVHLAWP